jgi:Acetyltransferase (GNAT) domain
MITVEIFTPQDPQWKETLQKLPHDAYHLPEYVEIEARRNDAIAEAISITQGDHLLFVPYLLRPCSPLLGDGSTDGNSSIYDVSSPYGYPGFLWQLQADSADFVPQAIQQLRQSLKERGACTAFFRLHPILGGGQDDFFEPGTLVENGETVSIDLTLTEAELWAHTRKGHQSTINKCKRLNLVSRMVPFAQYQNEFVQIYCETMDRVGAKASYYFDQEYFSALQKLGDHLHLGIVEQDDQVICASLFFECCGIVQAHLGGTQTAYLNLSPFNLLLHQARLWAKSRGNTVLHLGGGVGGSKEDRLYIFKSGFSRQRHVFKTARFVLNQTLYNALVEQRAQVLGVSANELLNSQFFPAYRATPEL